LGDPNAALGFGNLYREGHGVSQDYSEAVKWYRSAAEASPRADKPPLQQVQDKINIRAARLNLALMYYDGMGTQKNYEEAAKWYRMIAEEDPGPGGPWW
jgi:TPR repeat protein